MNTENMETVELLLNKKKEILDEWIKAQLESDTLREDLIGLGELRAQSAEFLDEFIKAIRSGNVNNVDTSEYLRLKEILRELSESRAQQGFSPSETATYVFSLKDTLLIFLQKQFSQKSEVLAAQIIQFNQLLDKLGLFTFESFTKMREGIITRQQQEILELSTPVIQVWDRILAIPLIGILDSGRTQIIMENLLKEIASTGAQITILDISGVPAMDTLVAQHLMKTVKAAKLMGAECIISGIRPGIAQTIVYLGVDLSDVKTKATFAGALRLAFDTLGMKFTTKQ